MNVATKLSSLTSRIRFSIPSGLDRVEMRLSDGMLIGSMRLPTGEVPSDLWYRGAMVRVGLELMDLGEIASLDDWVTEAKSGWHGSC